MPCAFMLSMLMTGINTSSSAEMIELLSPFKKVVFMPLFSIPTTSYLSRYKSPML